ncbi:glycosyltransferase family 2 protein [Mucilaginibacter sp. JRF]|uniref:glycosyltransferase family 2 protein n=1 Tax=Mucilaginibacter sp. JRF TaxID=2780088 RepID=UPI00187E1E90|nr:glycosyltransferase family 2 protein [Mucilaginibacter sp. JRF]MBE9585359.1 glycosyltransferase family 2 protein [Mucilaginibacter sp. JRF]
MKVALVVPTFNRSKLLIEFVEAMSKQTRKPDLLVVVNDGSTDNTSQLLAQHPEVTELKGDGNLWWTGAVNLGIQHVLDNHSEFDYIVLQNDDVIIADDWLEKLISVGVENPDSLVGSAAVDYRDKETITYAGKYTHKWFAYNTFIHKGKKISEINPDEPIYPFDLIGRGILIPVKVFKQIGIFDAKHFKHRGDTELPLRAKKAGFKLIVSFKPLIYDMPDKTHGIDIKTKYTFKDIKPFFWDFRSSTYIKYRYYYTKIVADNPIQFLTFFTCSLLAHSRKFLRKFRLS